MASCANCNSDALYVYQISSNYGINYCQSHLPSFLSRGPQPNLFEATAEEPVIESKSKTKKNEVVAEPEAIVEDNASNS